MANIITFIRIILSAVLLFCPALSPLFYAVYIVSGVSDMLDGAVARRTGTVSAFGSKPDTIADIVFVAVCLIKLLPVLHLPVRLYIWIAIIAIIKLFNIVMGYIKKKEFVAGHSVINKITGGVLFLFPLTLISIDPRYSAIVVCILATIAAIQEGYMIGTRFLLLK